VGVRVSRGEKCVSKEKWLERDMGEARESGWEAIGLLRVGRSWRIIGNAVSDHKGFKLGQCPYSGWFLQNCHPWIQVVICVNHFLLSCLVGPVLRLLDFMESPKGLSFSEASWQRACPNPAERILNLKRRAQRRANVSQAMSCT
jgi:hypothetical protein